MARPQPIVVPGGLSQQRTATDVQVDVGAIVNLIEAIRNQRRQAQEQQQFQEQFGTIFQKEVPLEGPPTQPQAAAMQAGGEFPTQRETPANLQALGKMLSLTPQGRQMGMQIAAKQALGGEEADVPTVSKAFTETQLELGLDPTKQESFSAQNAQAVQRKIQQRKIEISAAQGAGGVLAKAEAQFRIPITDANKLKGFVNPVTGEKPAAGITPEQLVAQGFIPETATKEGLKISTQASSKILDRLDSLADKVITAESEIDRLLLAPINAFKLFTQADKDLVLFQSLKEGVLSNIIRSFGEKGTLTDADIARARNLLPKITDTREVAKGKIQQVRDLIDEIGGRSPGTTPPPTKPEVGMDIRFKAIKQQNPKWDNKQIFEQLYQEGF